MSDRPVFLYAATYDDVADAEADYEAVFDLHALGAIGTFDSAVIRKDEDGKVQIAQTLEDDAQITSNTQLEALLVDEPPDVQDEILAINTDATNLALHVALLVPILAGLLGLFNAFRMIRLPDVAPSASVEAAALG